MNAKQRNRIKSKRSARAATHADVRAEIGFRIILPTSDAFRQRRGTIAGVENTPRGTRLKITLDARANTWTPIEQRATCHRYACDVTILRPGESKEPRLFELPDTNILTLQDYVRSF